MKWLSSATQNKPTNPKHPHFQLDEEQQSQYERSSNDYTVTSHTKQAGSEKDIENESLHRQHEIEVKKLDRNHLCSAVLDMHQQVAESQMQIDELHLEAKILKRLLEERKERNIEKELTFQQLKRDGSSTAQHNQQS